MITVYEWSSWVQGAGTRYDAIVPDHPEINATARSAEDVRELIVTAWNSAHHGEPKALGDFEFTAPPT